MLTHLLSFFNVTKRISDWQHHSLNPPTSYKWGGVGWGGGMESSKYWIMGVAKTSILMGGWGIMGKGRSKNGESNPFQINFDATKEN